MRENRTVVFASGQMSKPSSHSTITGGKLAAADFSELADQRDPVPGQSPLHRRTDAPQQRDRLPGEKLRGLGAAENREATRLVEVRGDLCENLLSLNPIDAVMP